METKEYRLKQLTEKITKGTTPSNIGESFTEEGIMYFRSELIGKSKYIDKSDGLLFISNETHEKLKRSQIQKNDLLFSMAGSYLGKISLVGDEDFPANTNQAVAIIRFNSKEIDLEYVYYYMTQRWYNIYINSLTAQAAQPNINLEQIGNLKLNLPPLPTQQKIASILSAYDDLIQNYKKQIEALQTAASELYKEWFVRFRFPGWQNAKFENGIPEGWKVVLASELGEFVRGKNITAEEMQEGMIPVISAGIEPSGFHNQSNVKGVSLTISNSGANAGYLQINYSDIWAADCSYCNSAKHIYFYYELLNNMRVVLFNLQKGAAQPHVYAKDINKMKILLPSTELIGTANKKIKLMHEKIYSLQQQITNLTQQRDLLLPRLMSSKLEVK